MTRLRASFAWARIPILNGIFILTPSAARFVFVPSTHRKKKEKRKERALMDGSFIKIRAGRWMTIECECFITNGNGGLVLHVTSTKYPPSRQRRKENLSISNQSR